MGSRICIGVRQVRIEPTYWNMRFNRASDKASGRASGRASEGIRMQYTLTGGFATMHVDTIAATECEVYGVGSMHVWGTQSHTHTHQV